jgi:2'-5' RNA ligase
MRLFIALSIPDAIRAEISSFVKGLRRIGGDVKWVEPENLHVTLKFMGETPLQRVSGITGAMDGALKGMEAFTVEMKGLGAFPGLQRPRVFWAGISGGAVELQSAAGSIEDALELAGFDRSDREFRAHLTIGRARTQGNLQGVAGEIARNSGRAWGEFRAQGIHLVQSRLSRQGPQYTIIHTTALGAGG